VYGVRIQYLNGERSRRLAVSLLVDTVLFGPSIQVQTVKSMVARTTYYEKKKTKFTVVDLKP